MDGRNIIGNQYAPASKEGFKAIDPSSQEKLEGLFYPATPGDADLAMAAAGKAFMPYSALPKSKRAAFLRTIAAEIEALGSTLAERAAAESGLPLVRLTGETTRTTGQLRMFADLVEEGSWVDATIDEAIPDRVPLPRPDLRKMLVPLGPVVVFGASNFPLAFSVAGGDTASALAAGCPVIVKAHPAHPGTSALVGAAVLGAAEKTGMPEGVFSLLFDDGLSIGQYLVKHPGTKAVTFTGSFRGGMALVDLARGRTAPIPVFAEMGSINPVVFLPEAIQSAPAELAGKYAASITLGAGQFCTNPGLMLVIKNPSLDIFVEQLSAAMAAALPATMLTAGICSNYQAQAEAALRQKGVTLLARSNAGEPAVRGSAAPILAKVSARDFVAGASLREEVFGPYSLLVICEGKPELQQAIAALEGQLTATVMAGPGELDGYTDVIGQLREITGRLILNGVPTGVEVCSAMQHGGPFPATSDSRFTSVGTAAVYRFVRPLSWQNWEQNLLPAELRDGNPLGIWRRINNTWTKD